MYTPGQMNTQLWPSLSLTLHCGQQETLQPFERTW